MNKQIEHISYNALSFLLQDESYYPFGMSLGSARSYSQPATKENNYLYNGKELQSDFGLEWYDYGARMYDPQIARWHCPDPMSDYREWLSPYNYCQNNPINRIDPTGAYDEYDKDEWYDDDQLYLGYCLPGVEVIAQRESNEDAEQRMYDEMDDPFEDFCLSTESLGDNHQREQPKNADVSNVPVPITPIPSSNTNSTIIQQNIIFGILSGGTVTAVTAANGLVNSASTDAWTKSVTSVKIVSSEAQAQRVLSKIVRVTKYAGWVGNTLTLGVSYTEAYVNRNTPNAGFYKAQAVGSTVIVGLNALNLAVPGLGTVLSITAGAVDASGGFDWVYESFNE